MDLLYASLDELARSPVLLVTSDYDGTIAPIVSDPSLAEANRESVVALKALAAMPQTHVAVISGRALKDLAQRIGEAQDAHLVGSHGSEFEAGFVAALPPETLGLLERLRKELGRIVEQTPGCMVEEKPAGLAFHYRNADEQAARKAVEEIVETLGTLPGVHIRHGKKVLELSVVETNKGKALDRLRQRLGARSVLFLGDDTTDEDAFARLTGPDIGIKVGPGETEAKYRVSDTAEASRVLARVAEKRATWLAGSHAIPIQQYSLLSDQRALALVSPLGRVAWLCLPRLDSSAVFAELVGGAIAGFFDICPVAGGRPRRQRYVGDSFVLQTDWPGLTVTDYLDCSGGRAFQRAGRSDLVRVIEGRGKIHITFAPRLDFGRVETRLRIAEAGVEIEGAVDPCVLFAPGIHWDFLSDGRHQTAVADVELKDSPVVLELRYGTRNMSEMPRPEEARRDQTQRFWSGWAGTLARTRLQDDLVRRSALALKALTYGPTGAIAAAATTSLPEHAGGVRNWDYRYCWPRDAAMAATALVRLGMAGPAMKLLDWLLGIIEHCEPPALICPVYTVTGKHLGSEAVVGELAGYRGSRPVRVGNAAAHQVQLDVFGPVAELLAQLSKRGAALSSEHWRMMEAMVGAVAHRWQEADHGIWEVRRPRQHHVHSKTMCWQTIDRALQVAEYLGHSRPEWAALRRTIADDILAQGWNRDRNAFCGTYEDSELDASVLPMGLCGLLAPDDPRFVSTVEAIERELFARPAVYRYRYDDNLPGIEGGFLLCTSWLIEVYALMGRQDDAEALLDQYVALAGPTGLFSEEYDPDEGQALGNYPQAYSHIGLINAVLSLAPPH